METNDSSGLGDGVDHGALVASIEEEILRTASQRTFVHVYSALIKLHIMQGIDPLYRIRLQPVSSMELSRSEVESVSKVVEKESPPTYLVTVNILGLYGPNSPLPRYYTEQIAAEALNETHGFRFFLDLIHQRLYQILYDKKVKGLPHHSVENQLTAQRALLALVGMRPSKGKLSDPVSHEVLKNLNIFRHRLGTKEGLIALTNSLFDTKKTKVTEFVEDYLRLKDDSRFVLSKSGNTLGDNCVIGRGLRQSTSRVTVDVGRISQTNYAYWIDGESGWQILIELYRRFASNFVTIYLRFEIEGATCGSCLEAQSGAGLRLGRDAWLREPRKEADSLAACLQLV